MKILRGERELSERDVDEIPKGMIPGEWICLVDSSNQKKYVGYINPGAEIFFKIKIVENVSWQFDVKDLEENVAKNFISKLLIESIERRKIFSEYEQGARLAYGINDSLPGLIVDKYKKYILIQINTAGMDRFRETIKKIFQDQFKNHRVIFHDNEEYRKAEVLPFYETEKIDEDLEVVENGLAYQIPKNILQKIGYYYDHRENRSRLKKIIERLNIKKNTGLDLFSYVGSWGLHLLAANVENVVFVDQGQMNEAITKNLELNSFKARGNFIRSDVFKYLDKALEEKTRFDIIVSDPPAFTKSEKNKPTAIAGYEKLHTKALKLLNDEGLIVVASCTHYVTYEELDRTVQEAARKNSQQVQMLDIGCQGFDHTMTGLNDKSFYIKYLVYYVRRG